MAELPHSRARLLALLAECEAAWSQWPPEKCSSLMQVIQAVLTCYLNEDDHRAVMLLTQGRGEDECISLMAINAEDGQVQDLVDTLCVFRQLDTDAVGRVLN